MSMTHAAADAATSPQIPDDFSSYTQPIEAIIASMGTNIEQGLTEVQATERRGHFGFNELPEAPPEHIWQRILRQFTDLVVWVLIAAAILAGLVREWTDAAVIIAIVILNAALGAVQEERAGRALAALRRLSVPQARLLRDGAVLRVPARELVPGDRIILEAGDRVPADARLLFTIGLTVQESALTGESAAVEKDANALPPRDAPLGDRLNMTYLGTIVTAGKADAIVLATSLRTELGKIADLLASEAPEPTPLQRQLSGLGRALILACLGLVGVVLALQMLRGGKLTEVLLTAVGLAVAAIPEGLPAVVTVALALGLRRMSKRHALIRRLPSVETLGSVTVICTDKTGTLTRGEMTVREIVTGGRRYEVPDAGHAKGHFLLVPSMESTEPLQDGALARLLTIGVQCNQATMNKSGDADAHFVGDPTEVALLVAAMKAGLSVPQRREQPLFERPFTSDRKMMSVVVNGTSGARWLYAKGAPEAVLGRCITELQDGAIVSLSDARRFEILAASSGMAGRGLRVLALAYRELNASLKNDAKEQELVFAGLAAMLDPPREEARSAVIGCHRAGIRPVMITGDHPETAMAIARELGISRGASSALTGPQLDALSDAQLQDRVAEVSVYARVSATHKLRIVRALKARGEIVAMTGDGVNDAPAVKAADIGIAMGITGTDVTKDASDLVLTDDNFASIVSAVEEGRGVFDNIQKFVHYLLACNAGEILFMLAAALIGWPLPLSAIQLLWINLVTDGLPALGLGVEPPERDILSRPPRRPLQPIVNVRQGLGLLLHASFIAGVTIAAFGITYRAGTGSLARAQTIAFCTIALAQLAYAFVCRSHRYTLPELGLSSNLKILAGIAGSAFLQLAVVLIPALRSLFRVTALAARDWMLVVVLALLPATIVEVMKLVRKYNRSGMLR